MTFTVILTSTSKVCLAYLVALCQLLAGAGEGYLAGLHDIGTMGNGKCHLCVLLDQQDGDAIYSSGKNAKENAEYFALQSNIIRQEAVGIDPFRISSSMHKGYNVYRTNNTC